ncbi:MAG: DnaJ domain-containing protein [Treponema sp.]|nr:DnaJ domain-containing protein [Treponema sp.]
MNLYDILGVPRDADEGAIKRGYFSAVKLHSPDSDPEGFKAVRLAYETLSDKKKRAQYDSYFVAEGEEQGDLLEARALLGESKYKQALARLSALNEKWPESAEVKRLLAQAQWRMKKSGAADKLCAELLEKNPADAETLLLRAAVAASCGHRNKADKYFDAAVAAEPLSAKAWLAYLGFSMQEQPWKVWTLFRRAAKQDPEMFRGEYAFYIVGAYSSEWDFATRFSEEDLPYYDKFAQCFAEDKGADEAAYKSLMAILPRLLEKNELIPFAEKVLPVIEGSRHCAGEDLKRAKYARASIVVRKLREDKRLHEVLVDLTEHLLFEDDDQNERLSMECYIVFNLPTLRPSLKALKNDYPELFKLHWDFYNDALNEKKTDFLIDKYAPINKRLLKIKRGETGGADGDFDEEDDLDETNGPGTITRAAPKIGRNVPCPCGSGKKYKKCCG